MVSKINHCGFAVVPAISNKRARVTPPQNYTREPLALARARNFGTKSKITIWCVYERVRYWIRTWLSKFIAALTERVAQSKFTNKWHTLHHVCEKNGSGLSAQLILYSLHIPHAKVECRWSFIKFAAKPLGQWFDLMCDWWIGKFLATGAKISTHTTL